MTKTSQQRKNNNSRQKAAMDDWVSSLAKSTNASENSNTNNAPAILSKDARKEKRAAKKARREEQQELKRPVADKERLQQTTKEAPVKKRNTVEDSRRRLKRLAIVWKALKRQYQSDRQLFDPQPGKKKKRKAWNEDSVQPRNCDYSGIGLARKSLFVSFLDPSYFPKLEEEFNEHIPGFFGKQRTKAMKRQLDGNMLWRKMASGTMSKKLKSMTPDQRVQAMIDSGMV